MTANQLDTLEGRLRRLAQDFSYPQTPDFAFTPSRPRRSVRLLPRPAQALALASVLLLALVAVPGVRAVLLDFLQIGTVRIQVPLSPASPQVAATVASTASSTSQIQTLYALEDLNGQTTLELARQIVDFELSLPGYPADLGEPDYVFVQQVEGTRYFVILVWTSNGRPEIALYSIGPGVFITKGEPTTLQELEVNGRPAAFVEGGHLLIVRGFSQFGGLVDAPTLIWEGSDGLTYRLEAQLPLDEIVKIAESIP